MSEHAIEDLVEDSVRLLVRAPMEATARCALIGELYAFQDLYDTSDTRGRLANELASIGYDDKTHDRVRPRPWPEIVADVVLIADGAGERQLVHHWLGAFAAGIDELTLIDDGLPEDFPAFRERPSVNALRDAAIRHDVHRWRGKTGYVRLPTYRSIADGYDKLDPQTVDRRTMLRLLLDHKNDPDRIEANYAKERKRIALMDTSALFDLPAMVEARGPFRFVGRSKDIEDHVFVFEAGPEPDDPDASRILLVLSHMPGFNTIAMEKAVRSGLLARWQAKTFGGDDTAVHFEREVTYFVPHDQLEAEKHLNTMGWRYRMDQSAKVLGQRLDAMLALWGYGRTMEEFYRTPLAERIDAEGFAGMAEQRLTRLERFGFFSDEVDMLFACACRSWDRGVPPEAEIAAIEEHLRHIRPGALGRSERIAMLERLRAGPAFPLELQRFPYRRHEETFPLVAE